MIIKKKLTIPVLGFLGEIPYSPIPPSPMSHVLLVDLLTFLRKALNDLNETKEQHCNWS